MSGQFKGLCVRGGAEVDLKWEKRRVNHASIKASCINVFKVKLPLGGKPELLINGLKQSYQVDNNRLISLKL